MKKVIAAAVLLGLMGVVYAAFFREGKARHNERSEEGAEASPEGKVVHVHHHTTRIIHEGAPAPTTEPPAQPAQAPGTAAPNGPPTEAQRSSFAENVFRGQTPDAAWSREAESSIRSRIEQLPNNAIRVTEIQCRSTLCRVAVESDDEEKAREYSDQVRRTGVWSGPGMLVRAQDGREPEPGQRFFMTFFFAKPGTKLPDQG